MASLASKLGDKIVSTTKNAVTDFGAGIKGAFISANPAVFGPLAKSLASNNARKEKEKEQRQQGFMEENFLEDRKIATDTLSNIVAINRNTASMDRTLKELLELMKKCCMCKCDESFLGLPRLPGPRGLPAPSVPRLPGPVNVPRLPGPGGTSGGARANVPVAGGQIPPVGTLPTVRPGAVPGSIPAAVPVVIVGSVAAGGAAAAASGAAGVPSAVPIVVPQATSTTTQNRPAIGSDPYNEIAQSLRDAIATNIINQSVLNSATNDLLGSYVRLRDNNENAATASGFVAEAAGRASISISESAGRASGALSDVADRTPRLGNAIESAITEASRAGAITSESTLRIAQATNIFTNQLNEIIRNAARVPVAVGAEVPIGITGGGIGGGGGGASTSSIYRLGGTTGGITEPVLRLSGGAGGGGVTPMLGYSGARPGTSLALTYDRGRFISSSTPIRPGTSGFWSTPPGPGVTDVWVSNADRLRYGAGVAGDYLRRGYGAYTSTAASLESSILRSPWTQRLGLAGIGYSGISGALDSNALAASLGMNPYDLTTTDRFVGGASSVAGGLLGFVPDLVAGAFQGGVNIGNLMTGGNFQSPVRYGDFSSGLTQDFRNVFSSVKNYNSIWDNARINQLLDAPGTGGTFPSTLSREKPSRVPSLISDPDFLPKVNEVASRLGVSPRDLLAIMAFESGLDPSKPNVDPSKPNAAGSGAMGLIQFMPDTAKGLGTNTLALSRMKASEQLDWVEKYYKSKGVELKPGSSLEDIYLSTFMPAARDKNDMFVMGRKDDTTKIGNVTRGKIYEQNWKSFDPTGKGYFTRGDVAAVIRAKAYSRLDAIAPELGYFDTTTMNSPYSLMGGETSGSAFSANLFGLNSPFGASYSLMPGRAGGEQVDPEQVSDDIENTSDGITEILDVSQEQSRDTRTLVTNSYEQMRQQQIAAYEAARQYELYRRTEEEKARRLEGYEAERKQLQEQFDSQMQGIFRPMVNALMGPGGAISSERAGSTVTQFLSKDFAKLGTSVFGKIYGPGIGQTFQQLTGLYTNMFINETLAPMLGMRSDLLNRSINTFIKGVEVVNPQLKQVNATLAASRETLKRLETGEGSITQADIVRAAGAGGFTPQQQQRLAELASVRGQISSQEAKKRELEQLKSEYRTSALGDLIYGMSGIAVTPKNLIESYAGGAEGLTKDLASFFGAPFNPLFNLDKAKNVMSAEEIKKIQDLDAKIAADKKNQDAIRKINEDQVSAFKKEIIPGIQDAVAEGMKGKTSGGGGTNIPGSNIIDWDVANIQGGGKASTQSPEVKNRLLDFGLNLVGQALGGKVSRAFGGGIPGALVGNVVSGTAIGILKGQSVVQTIGAQMGIKLPENATFSDLGSAINKGFNQMASGVGNVLSNLGSFTGSGTLAEFGAGMRAYGSGAQAGQMASGSAAQYGAYAGQALSTLGYATAARPFAKAISGGYSAFGKSGNAAINVGTAAGAFFGPIGAAIGSILGGVVNRLFGKRESIIGGGLSGTIGGGGGISSISGYNTKLTEYGGIRSFFQDDRIDRIPLAIDDETKRAFDDITKAMFTGTKEMLEAIGSVSSNLDSFVYSLNVVFGESDTEEQKMQKIQDALTLYQNNLIDAGNQFIKLFADAGETTSEALLRLSNAVLGAKPILESMGFIGRTGLLSFFGLDQANAGGNLAALVADRMSDLQDAFGGVENFQNEMRNLISRLFTPEEQAQINLVNLDTQMNEYVDSFGGAGGISLPTDIPDDVATARTTARTKFAELRDKLITGEITPEQYRAGVSALTAYLTAAEQNAAISSVTPEVNIDEWFPDRDEYGNVIASTTEPITEATNTALEEAYAFVESITGTSATIRQTAQADAAAELVQLASNAATSSLTSATQDTQNAVNQIVNDVGGIGVDSPGGSSSGMTAEQAASTLSAGLALSNFGATLSGSSLSSVSLAVAATGAIASAAGNAAINAANEALATIDDAMIGGSVAAAQAASAHAADMAGGSADIAGAASGVAGDGLGLDAWGGNVPANSPRIVGEVGPEIFIPNYAGNIVPTHRIIDAVQSASQLDSQTRSLLNQVTSPTNSIAGYYLNEESQRRNYMDEAPQINSAIVDNSVRNISSPKTTVVNRGDHVRDNHPMMNFFTRNLTASRL